MPNIVCRNVQKGGVCRFGSKCRFQHPIGQTIQGVAYSFGSCVKQQRAHEDRHMTHLLSPELRLFMVCDGHGNPRYFRDPDDDAIMVVDYVIQHLHVLLSENLQCINMDDEANVMKTIGVTFVQLDMRMKEENLLFGTTCNMVIVDQLRKKLYCANLGDSRIIILNQNKIVFESKDHHVQDEEESKRIHAAGGYLVRGTHICVPSDHNNAIGVSRAFGDFNHKTNKGVFDPINGAICAVPTICTMRYKPHMTLLLMSDAVFGCAKESAMTSQNVVDTFLSIENRMSFPEDVIAQTLCTLCLKRTETNDDITFMIVNLFE